MKLRILLVPLVAVAVALPSTTAYANTLSTADASGDVLKIDDNSEVVDATQANGDIIRTVISHGPRNVKIKIVYRDLVKAGQIITFAAVKSNKGRSAFRTFTIAAAPGRYNGNVRVENAHGKKMTCRTTRNLDYTANTALLTIPRKCLGFPKWVQVGVGVFTMTSDAQSMHIDDARGNGKVGNPYFSPRIYR